MRIGRSARGLTAAMLLALGAYGCGGYVLTGRVVEGAASEVAVVRGDDPRLAGPPIGGASVRIMLDPQSLGGELVGTVSTGEDGRFAVPIDATGAGVLEYDVLVEVRASERDSAYRVLPLPPNKRTVLVTLAPGRDRLPPPQTDPLQDVERYMPR